jgi:hypothetical protein
LSRLVTRNQLSYWVYNCPKLGCNSLLSTNACRPSGAPLQMCFPPSLVFFALYSRLMITPFYD